LSSSALTASFRCEGSSRFFCDQLANGVDFHRQSRDHAILARALGFELFEPRQVAGFQAAILFSPEADGIGVDAVATAKLRGGCAGVEFLENPNDLRFGEPGSSRESPEANGPELTVST
jgi:hypothetical protein